VLAQTVGTFTLFVGMINLVPGLPLDGGRMLRAVFWALGGTFEWASNIALRLGQLIAYGMILGGAAFGIWQGNWIWGVALLLAGWSLLEAAGTLYRRGIVAQLLDGLTAADVVRLSLHTVTPDTTLRACWPLFRRQGYGAVLPVADDTHFYGLITSQQILDIPQGYWDARTVTEAMTPVDALAPIAPTTSVRTLVSRLAAEPEAPLPIAVVDAGQLRGLVDTKHMNDFLDLEAAFGLVAHTVAASEGGSTPERRAFRAMNSPSV
jgi:CBS domain-containing protein